MRRHITAVVLAVALIAVMLVLSLAITGERVKNPGQAQVSEEAVEAIGASLRGGECPDTTRLMPIQTVRIADALLTAARNTPQAEVPAPSGEGEVALGEVPGLLADELETCIARSPDVGPGWQRVVTRLRG